MVVLMTSGILSVNKKNKQSNNIVGFMVCYDLPEVTIMFWRLRVRVNAGNIILYKQAVFVFL